MPHARGVEFASLPRARRAAVALGLLSVACTAGSPSRPVNGVAPSPSCAIIRSQPGAAGPVGEIAVAAAAPLDRSHVPIPRSVAERFAFAQLYETLIGVDCEGRAYPALAKSWMLDGTGTRITLLIRDGAQFWDGKPLVTSDVVAAWRATGGQSTAPSRLAARVAEEATIVDDRTLTISLPDTAWRILADPALAVYRPQPGAAWAEGTARYRVDERPRGSDRGSLLLADPSAAGPGLAITPIRAGDARDAIDRGADVVVTADPLTISYAATRPELAAISLPWSRAYALAVPRFGPADAALLGSMLGDSAFAFRASLARDAVRVEAHAADSLNWWSDVSACEPLGPLVEPQRGAEVRPMRFAYDASDRVARQLAERLAALGNHATAVPLAHDAFARALHDGSEPAYVIALSRAALDACEDAAKLVTSAPWILALGGAGTSSAAPRVIPLIETRDRAIVNRDRVAATIDWDGTLRFGGAARAP